MNNMIIVDVGSTTTKALLFGRREAGWRYWERGEAATTVEAPAEDVMIGVWRAIRLLEERSGVVLLHVEGEEMRLLCEEFLATSSAGGGLQMVVCGNLLGITGESARRAALGGGAILLDVFAADDGRHHFHRLERLRTLRPDMILLSGGVEGARNIGFMVEMCDFIRTAKPRPKFGYQHTLPIIYAGASGAIPVVQDLLGEDFYVKVVDNLRPAFDRENLTPTREAIHDLFIEHVMSHAPGYDHLQERVTRPLLPTPSAVGEILTRYARHRKANILCIDIGGATTDVFSVVEQRYVRSVSANYGMSYSIGNVASTAGVSNLKRWLPEQFSDSQVKLRIGAKLLHPVSIPAQAEDLWIEQAAAREALRLAFEDHLEITKNQPAKNIFEFELLQKPREIGIEQIDVIIGSGGVLSNAPQRGQAAAMLIDAFQPVGATELLVDSVFMLPHLGVFAGLDETNALQVLEKDGLIPLGTVLAPKGRIAPGLVGLQVRGVASGGRRLAGEVRGGELLCLPLAVDETAEIEVKAQGGVHWPGATHLTVRGGVCGLVLDMRGRPLRFEADERYNMAWVEELCREMTDDK